MQRMQDWHSNMHTSWDVGRLQPAECNIIKTLASRSENRKNVTLFDLHGQATRNFWGLTYMLRWDSKSMLSFGVNPQDSSVRYTHFYGNHQENNAFGLGYLKDKNIGHLIRRHNRSPNFRTIGYSVI
jgi:hypothetical protein